ncbi:MAG: hypothetical protein R2847_09055 [Bacteroidia bacterium]
MKTVVFHSSDRLLILLMMPMALMPLIPAIEETFIFGGTYT